MQPKRKVSYAKWAVLTWRYIRTAKALTSSERGNTQEIKRLPPDFKRANAKKRAAGYSKWQSKLFTLLKSVKRYLGSYYRTLNPSRCARKWELSFGSIGSKLHPLSNHCLHVIRNWIIEESRRIRNRCFRTVDLNITRFQARLANRCYGWPTIDYLTSIDRLADSAKQPESGNFKYNCRQQIVFNFIARIPDTVKCIPWEKN